MMSVFAERLKSLMSENETDMEAVSKLLEIDVSVIYRWLRDENLPKLTSLVKMADRFKCSLDYLTGRTAVEQTYSYKTCPPFSERLPEVLKELKVTDYKIHKETALSRSQFYGWYHGQIPRMDSLITLADYLDCTLDYLVGRE